MKKRQLPPEIEARIVSFMDRNTQASSFRLACRAAAANFSGPQHTTIRLSRPVPPQAFAAHWLALGATRGLTLARRRQLLRLTAASGCVANLEVALEAVGCLPVNETFAAAAAAGQLGCCKLLRDRCGLPCGAFDTYCGLLSGAYGLRKALAAAAGGGHQHVCEWLLAVEPRAWSSAAVGSAARGGHVGLMEWLLERGEALGLSAASCIALACIAGGAAHGCGLAALRRLWPAYGQPLPPALKARVLAAAAGSPTPDWAAKVEWLEAQGCPKSERVAEEAAVTSTVAAATARAGDDDRRDGGADDGAEDGDAEALARLTWLQGRGYPYDVWAVRAAADAGRVSTLCYLLGGGTHTVNADGNGNGNGAPPQLERSGLPVTAAAKAGSLAALRALRAAGWPLDAGRVAAAAARGGHLHVLAWLLGERGAGAAEGSVRLDAELFAVAAESGSVELLAWLRERGCGWDGGAFTEAAKAGAADALKWLVAQGCPMEESGQPYIVACGNGDLATAACLRRLGVPWGPPGAVLGRLQSLAAPKTVLRWLEEQAGGGDGVRGGLDGLASLGGGAGGVVGVVGGLGGDGDGGGGNSTDP
ncbi:hypothetical protein GPECTOR_125g503 [Gonium pectorale]|uniref:Uncharacterized protein n=1 Tax=Gonium pectorale TaxID=33097 RepID=A0A150G027_GONPE|nr:hypothetical protein GPECTOR_125g503 [Gonium pectorale]|eukprot:KXZ42670.1 hypothetical protein GPECTOR_125g503 [Gonium pectorale]